MMLSASVAKRKRVGFTILMVIVLLWSQWLVSPQAQGKSANDLNVYDDGLSSEFVYYGWADVDLASTDQVKGGSHSVRMKPDGDKALYFYKDRVMSADDYGTLRFWIHGGEKGGQQVKLVLSLGGQPVAEKNVGDLVEGGSIPAGKWSEVRISLAELGVTGLLDGFWLWGEGDQESIYVDDISFVAGGSGGSNQEEPNKGDVVGLIFEQPQLLVREGSLLGATLTARYADGTLNRVTSGVVWSSADTEIAEIVDGLVKGLKPGQTTITARYDGVEATVPIEVLERGETAPIDPVDGIYLYDDSLNNQFTDYGWVTHELNDHDVVHSGESSIRMLPSGDDPIYLYSDRVITAKEYEKLQIWFNGGQSGGQQLKLVFMSGGQAVKELSGSELFENGVPGGQWTKLEWMLEDLKLPGGLFDGLIIAGTGGQQAALYLDDLALVRKYVAPPALIEVRMDKPELILRPGETNRMEAETLVETGATEVVSGLANWQSGNPAVVTVNNGELAAISPGISRITASYKGFTAVAYVQVTETAAELVYDDSLAAGFHDQSWHDKDLANSEQAYEGTSSIKFEPDGWDGVWLVSNAKKEVSDYYGIDFWIHGGSTGGQKLTLHGYNGTMGIGAVDIAKYAEGGSLPANEWTHVTANFADLGITDGQFDGFVFQAATEDNQAAVYIDDVKLLKNLNAGQLPEPELPALTVTVDKNSDRRPINPEIYGINYSDSNPTDSALKFPVQRWGGNNTTRYNWQLDTANRSSDWYFMNYPYNNDHVGDLPNGSTSDRFIDGVHEQGGQVLLTVPTIGWTPKSRELTFGFSQKKYGKQQSAPREHPDAGNGVLANGIEITNNDPTDTSKPIGPEFVTDWMKHISDRTDNQLHYYALDNEPEIWHVTHRDVHPQAPTYDEIWGFTERYGSAIKAQDSNAKIFGPTSWGWCAYFYSSADNCADGPDRQAHEGKPFLQWYLEKAKAYEEANGVRLVDYLDIHFYPQENGVPSAEEGPAVVKRRFQSLKSLYDPNFIDQSWIQEPIRLIPRMKELINEISPETKLAITEYNFGNGEGISAGLAQAEALAIFGREGVDLATRFGTLPANTPLEDAFKLYLDYDGQGSQIKGESVRATSAIPDALGSYAIVGADGKTYVLLFNKDSALRSVNVKGSFGEDRIANVYRFNSSQRLSASGDVNVGESGFTLKLPAKSAALVVIQP